MGNWFIAAKKADFQKIAETFQISPVLARLIRNRDVEGMEAVRKYLYGTKADLYAPQLMTDMEKAAEIIKGAIAQGKKIRVIGDYDVDGICASFILEKAIRIVGGNVDTAIPHRITDGYGLNEELIKAAAQDGVELIVTCDNGIAAASQIELAKSMSMQVIVTDHHEIPYETEGEEKRYILPPADAVVDPKRLDDTYPFSGICGAVVAYKLAQMLDIGEAEEEALLEPAAIATICDVMELQDENRILVREGLKRIRQTSHPGLRALIEVNGLKQREISSYHIGFVIGPCLNASGRLESAHMALKLLLEEDYTKAVKMAAELKALNDSRKDMTEQGVVLAVQEIEATLIESGGVLPKVLVVYLPSCHESLAGIVAGRIREKYNRPAIILTKGEEGVKGSGRSVESYDMYEELSKVKLLFTKFGGHKMAAGLSMKEEDIDTLRERLCQNCTLGEADFEPKVHIDIAMPVSYVTEEFVKELELLEPFGVGNSKPVFAQKNVLLTKAAVLGKSGRAIKFRILDDLEMPKDMMYFGNVDELLSFLEQTHGKELVQQLFREGNVRLPLTVTYYPDINEYRGVKTVQIIMTNYCNS
ncbi:MAG: single-stranded-DNA-specific exonuclease RecJ [Lachnospiraceae bacterium]|nr:single-stranded-DNA-specific exonuclease RecJ [Lachnospiraceae bacterium]